MRSAVLFLVFNRPEPTTQVFEAIRQAKPPRLYVAADGPRPDREGEAVRCEEVRRIATDVDWPCEVVTLFREKNLGCKYAVSGAITWFFEQEEEGIILEDDCLPAQSFFGFCDELLKKYKYDKRIGHISGYNHFPNRVFDCDYFYSLFPGIWGWATWADRWKDYNVILSINPNVIDALENRLYDKKMYCYWYKIFNSINDIDTWDYQWCFTLLTQGYLSIRPSKNLVTNIGFGNDATHTKTFDKNIFDNKADDVKYINIKGPRFYVTNKKDDKMFFSKRLDKPLIEKIICKIKNALF
ncbi:hypothetical protein Q9L42_011480 [Methylomarinum sp. Ch1-1]|uniref:Nucleotide-diphospho-sugar transferase n=1 Tax=Methylomarinum roseum TaxID=3067653 RepID=A0AAU7NPW8_9GAMM|nr:nucleotide-diphospho-sugar transferase [Methylomarinum sp. Ch1-1]MDP4521082.1 nucleotide-diphospho-sugar transferase [Methylomarinum sp. Ch1-1]